jgi:hypothetical protein
MELQSHTNRLFRGFIGVQAILKAIRTIKLSCFINNKNIDLYLYNTLYILNRSINLIYTLKLWAKEVKIGFNNDDITITIKGMKFKAFLLYSLYTFNI